MKWNIELFCYGSRIYLWSQSSFTADDFYYFFRSPLVRLLWWVFSFSILFLASSEVFTKVSHLNCLWAKRMWKMFVWFSFSVWFGDSWPCTGKFFIRFSVMRIVKHVSTQSTFTWEWIIMVFISRTKTKKNRKLSYLST